MRPPPRKTFDRIVALLVVTSFLFSLAGCSSLKPPPPPPAALQNALQTRKIALIPGWIPVTGETELYAEGKAAGVGKGLGRGALGGLGFWAKMMAETPGAAECPLVLGVMILLLPVAVVVGGTAGAVWGGVKGTPKKVAKALESRLDEVLRDFDPQQELCRKVLYNAEQRAWADVAYVDLTALGEEGGPVEEKCKRLQGQEYGSVLEITVIGIELGGGEGSNPELAWHLRAAARLVSLDSSNAFYQRDFEYYSTSKRFSELKIQETEEIRADLVAAFEALASIIVDVLFFQTQVTLDWGRFWPTGLKDGGCCWHCPQSPPLDYSFWKAALQYPQASSLDPVLEWDQFPDEKERQLIKENTGGDISEVHYDLRVWQAEKGQPVELVYERSGLASPNHQLEEPLQPDSPYFWSFRACFQLEGRRACTPWAFSASPGAPCTARPIPFDNYYRFRTPGKSACEASMEAHD